MNFNIPTLIIGLLFLITILFSIRYLYKVSFQNKNSQHLFWQSASSAIYFIPIFLQGLLFFCVLYVIFFLKLVIFTTIL